MGLKSMNNKSIPSNEDLLLKIERSLGKEGICYKLLFNDFDYEDDDYTFTFLYEINVLELGYTFMSISLDFNQDGKITINTSNLLTMNIETGYYSLSDYSFEFEDMLDNVLDEITYFMNEFGWMLQDNVYFNL